MIAEAETIVIDARAGWADDTAGSIRLIAGLRNNNGFSSA
jgi:hypothetical protein